MTAEPHQEYVITEEELLDIASYIYHEDEVPFIRIARKIRSHTVCQQSKVLDDFAQWVKTDWVQEIIQKSIKEQDQKPRINTVWCEEQLEGIEPEELRGEQG